VPTTAATLTEVNSVVLFEFHPCRTRQTKDESEFQDVVAQSVSPIMPVGEPNSAPKFRPLTVINASPVDGTFLAWLSVTTGASNEKIPAFDDIPVPTTFAIVRGNAILVPSPELTEQTIAVLLVQNDDRHRVLPIVTEGDGSLPPKFRPAIVICAGPA